MSPFASPERDVIARQIADGLDGYKATMEAWLATPGNLELYEKLSGQIESLRIMSSSALPRATGALADLLLAHTDLTFIALKKHLVRLDALRPDADSGQLAKARERHEATLSDMRSLCVRSSGRHVA